jgi:L-iditol 2-dehydrogenase
MSDSNTMKALQITAPGKISEVDVPAPEISQPGEVKVRVQAVSIAAPYETNIFHNRFTGRNKCRYPCPPGFPGREGTGIIEAIGDNVRALSPGDRVLLCSRSGNLYQNIVVCSEPWAKKLETGAKAQDSAPAELFAGLLALLKRAEKIFRALCVVIGLGPAGLAAVMWLRVLGARQIWAIEEDAVRRNKGLEFGADYVFSPRDNKGLMEIKGMGPETVIECSGSHAGMNTALDMAKKDVLLYGYNENPFSVTQSEWADKNLGIKSQSSFNQEIWDETADYINRSFINPGLLVSCVLPLSADNYSRAMDKLKSPETVRIVLDLT